MSTDSNVINAQDSAIKIEEELNQQQLKGEPVAKVIDTETKWTNIQVDSQILSSFMACPAKYNYVFNRHLNPVGGSSKSITRGTICHNALLYYWRERMKDDMDYQTAIKAAIEQIKEGLNKDIRYEMDEKLEILQNMIDFFKHIQSLSWIPLAVEKYFRVLAYEDHELKLRIFLTGKIDLILRSPQIPVIPVDAKTESERWFYTQMSNQFKIYCFATGTNLLGVQRIGFQKSIEFKDKFKMEMLPFDADILEEWRTITMPFWVKQLIIAHQEGYFPMNSTSCVHGHFKCQFSDGAEHKGICNVSRSVREQKIQRYFVIGDPWDPSRIE